MTVALVATELFTMVLAGTHQVACACHQLRVGDGCGPIQVCIHLSAQVLLLSHTHPHPSTKLVCHRRFCNG